MTVCRVIKMLGKQGPANRFHRVDRLYKPEQTELVFVWMEPEWTVLLSAVCGQSSAFLIVSSYNICLCLNCTLLFSDLLFHLKHYVAHMYNLGLHGCLSRRHNNQKCCCSFTFHLKFSIYFKIFATWSSTALLLQSVCSWKPLKKKKTSMETVKFKTINVQCYLCANQTLLMKQFSKWAT